MALVTYPARAANFAASPSGASLTTTSSKTNFEGFNTPALSFNLTMNFESKKIATEVIRIWRLAFTLSAGPKFGIASVTTAGSRSFAAAPLVGAQLLLAVTLSPTLDCTSLSVARFMLVYTGELHLPAFQNSVLSRLWKTIDEEKK